MSCCGRSESAHPQRKYFLKEIFLGRSTKNCRPVFLWVTRTKGHLFKRTYIKGLLQSKKCVARYLLNIIQNKRSRKWLDLGNFYRYLLINIYPLLPFPLFKDTLPCTVIRGLISRTCNCCATLFVAEPRAVVTTAVACGIASADTVLTFFP